MYLHPSHQLNTYQWRWSHNFQLSSYNQFTAQQEKVARKQSPALSRICGHEMQIAAAVMFKLRSFEPAYKWCSSLLHYRWIPCYVFGDTLVVNIMGVTAVTSLLLRWWWWWLLSGVAATWGAILCAVLCWSVEALEIIFQNETFLMGGWVYAQIWAGMRLLKCTRVSNANESWDIYNNTNRILQFGSQSILWLMHFNECT